MRPNISEIDGLTDRSKRKLVQYMSHLFEDSFRPAAAPSFQPLLPLNERDRRWRCIRFDGEARDDAKTAVLCQHDATWQHPQLLYIATSCQQIKKGIRQDVRWYFSSAIHDSMITVRHEACRLDFVLSLDLICYVCRERYLVYLNACAAVSRTSKYEQV